MREENVEITEYFNSNGVCIKRTANGVDLPADTEPSVFFMEDVTHASQKIYMTTEEFEKSGYKVLLDNANPQA